MGGVLTNDQHNEIQSSGLAPTNNLESAMIVTLDAGAYTTVVRGVNNGIGTALVEIYELDQNSLPRLVNISTRGSGRLGNDILIAGFVVVELGVKEARCSYGH